MVDQILADLDQLYSICAEEVAAIENQAQLDQLRPKFFGKKSPLSTAMKNISGASPDEKAAAGKKVNETRAKIDLLFSNKVKSIQQAYYEKLGDLEFLDPTEPPTSFPSVSFPFEDSGHPSPLMEMQQTLENIFSSMGFSIYDGPHVESDYYNFEALNFSDDHPAREMQDTFYFENGSLLRTHTSAVQVRALEQANLPLRMIVPGRVFRYEEQDASHEHTFYQMEGMIIDKEISVANLLHLMQTLLKGVFQSEVKVRLRPGYFPFVEPGFELDMSCLLCSGSGCSVCKHTGWVEVLPCGLVHPNVLKAASIDPDQWQGAAFGLGLNRLVMMQNGIEDIRYFQNPQIGFLYQFRNNS
jgi:phenylalanyl-tRNA synthetase alpha chain